MEWVIGIYVAVGLYKAFETLAADATDRPLWMYSQRNPVISSWGQRLSEKSVRAAIMTAESGMKICFVGDMQG
jgi:hypothetical protein